MSEQKMTYQEKLEKEKYDIIFHNEVSSVESHAKRNIAAQAEAIREVFEHAFASFGGSPEFVKSATDKYLLNHGYIEPKTEESGTK